MRAKFIFFLLAIALRVNAQGISPAQLQGAWTSVTAIRDISLTLLSLDNGTMVFGVPSTESLLISGDSIFSFQYPCQLYSGSRFRLQGDSVFFDGEKITATRLKLLHDTLIRIALSSSGILQTTFFFRTTFDLKMIRKLQKDTLNPECITGKMRKVNQYYLGDGSDQNNTAAAALPDTVFLELRDISGTGLKKRTVFLSVNGKREEFYIDTLQWSFENTTGEDIYHPNNPAAPFGKGILRLYSLKGGYPVDYEFGLPE